MNIEVRVEVLESLPLLVARRRARSAEFSTIVPEACGAVWNHVKQRGLKGAGRHVPIYLDDQTNLEVGVEMAAPCAGEGEIAASQTPAGRVATATHFGPHQHLGKTHAAIRNWCALNHHALEGPNWEIYGHWVEEWSRNPANIRTDVYYLLGKMN